jgi:hypothetical protein
VPVDWKSDDMLKWKDLTQQKQQEYCDSPHIVKWREWKLSDTFNLKNNFGFALFYYTEKEPVKNFTDEQLKYLHKILGIINKKYVGKNENEFIVCLSVLFVLIKLGDRYKELPVVKLLINDIKIQ